MSQIYFDAERMAFIYDFSGLGVDDVVIINNDGDVEFETPVSDQRFLATLFILEDPRWSGLLKKVVEFGCNDMKFLQLMRRIETLEHIIQVDIDGQTLTWFQDRADPLLSDYVNKRKCPLRIEIFQGNAAHSVENLRNVDAVVAIELIQHLKLDVLEEVTRNIFGFIQPKIAIFSTPNREYNVLFKKLTANGFRIHDHKFEWTREEFSKWASNICKRYQNYSVAFIGVGSPPATKKTIGHVTQIAIFARNDIIDRPLKSPIAIDIPANSSDDIQYKEISSIDYPHDVDNRPTEQKLKDEALLYINKFQKIYVKFFNPERDIYLIPLKPLINHALSINALKEDVLNVLKELKFDVEDNYILLTEEWVHEGEGDFDSDEDAEDFLQYDRYDPDEDEDSTHNSSKYVENDEPEESWD